jgi:hypothetical protein
VLHELEGVMAMEVPKGASAPAWTPPRRWRGSALPYSPRTTMADHNIDILLRARDQASKVIRGVNNELSRTQKIGDHASRGLRNAGRNVAVAGVGIAAGIGLAVHTGIRDLAELEDSITSVDGAIKAVGLTGQVTGTQVAKWANDIERDVQAAFDDKEITAATSNLIRYGKVVPENLRTAMTVMTDLAVRTGDVETASKQLAKALADPTKASGALRKAGIVLTAQQQKQIDAMVKAGDVAGAQAAVLDALAASTEGAAAASKGPYADALNQLTDASEDARKALAEGFLPVISKVAGMLEAGVADESTMKNIREFGQGLASGLDDLIDIAKALPWATIGDSLKIAGAGAKAVLSAFASLPPWVQTAVLTGWGLNKLTGGALGDIVGELGKGLIKGVLGMQAGVVNLTAGVVNGVPGIPGGPAKVPPVPLAPKIGAGVMFDVEGFQRDFAKPMLTKIGMEGEQTQQKQEAEKTATTTTGAQLKGAVAMGTGATTIAVNSSTGRIVGAIQANRPVVSVQVINNVSATTFTQSQTTNTRTGSGSSRTNDSGDRIGGV